MIVGTAAEERPKWLEDLKLTVTDCTIRWATFGNGVRIGMERIIIVNPQLRIRQGQAVAHPGCCGAVLGS